MATFTAVHDATDHSGIPGVTGALHNLEAGGDPTVNDDEGDGYSVGSLWRTDSTGDKFVCVDPAAGAAVWDPFEGAAAYADVSGGSETTGGGFQYNEFPTSGTLTVNSDGIVDVLIVGGGGGGGGYFSGGGGGGGQVLYVSSFPVTAGSVTVTVGAGGTAGSASNTVTNPVGDQSGGNGGYSAFGDLIAMGGGGGGSMSGTISPFPASRGKSGANGGGGGGRQANPGGTGRFAGANAQAGTTAGTGAGGGGGGASAAATNVSVDNTATNGGAGRTVSEFSSFGASGVFGGGGGGGAVSGGTGGTGGTGGGGNGGVSSSNTGMTAGTANTGGGGGGGGNTSTTGAAGGAGGTGVVITRIAI